MAIGDIFQTHVQLAVQDRQVTIGYAYRQTGGADPVNLAEHVNSAWNGLVLIQLQAMLSTNVIFQCIYTRQVTPGVGIPDTFNYLAVVGARPGAAISNDSPFVIKVITDALSSKLNGRQFIPGVSENDIIDGDLDPAFVIAQVAPYEAAFLTDIVSVLDPTLIFEPGIISRVLAGVPRVPPIFSHATGSTCDAFIKSQRRRRTRQTAVGI